MVSPAQSPPSQAANAPYRGIVVSHTHWDRAWYLPFQAFRLRLVRTVDRLIELLERDEHFRAFTLDGQTVLLEDYLEIRPERQERLRALTQSGRLALGPWYVLPDLFLVSGEAIVRNLQLGREQGEAFGNYTPVGYVPDPFGHCAQLPQLLRGFGIDSYIFMRGLDAQTKKTHGAVFDWQAPDGSEVLAVYQREGYFPVAALGHPHVIGRFEGREPDGGLARERLQAAVTSLGALQQERTLLLGNGFDHMPAQPELPELLAQLEGELEEVQLEHGTLPEFVAALQAEQQPHHRYRGDLLGNADHPILSSVYSTRLYLKQQNHRAQAWLARYAEPLSAWLEACGRGEDTRPFLRYAWRLLLRNHPHDDICGCSADAVHRDNEARFRQVDQIAEVIATEGLEHLVQAGFEAAADPSGRGTEVWAFNPHPWPQAYRLEARLHLPHPDGEGGEPLPQRSLLGCDAGGREVPVAVRRSEPNAVRSRFLQTTWARQYDVAFELTLPPLGYQLVRIREGAPPEAAPERAPLALENEHYRAEVADGGLTLTEKATGVRFESVLRLEYQLDAGDTYTFGPVPNWGPWWAELAVAERHPERREALRLHYRLQVPAGYDRARGPYGEATLLVTADVSLDPSRALAIELRYDNTARNGRLRAVLPVGFAARHALADGHFRLAPRTKPHLRTPESDPERYGTYPGELDYPTHHQGDFVLLEGEAYRVWVANRGLPEYELLEPEGDTAVAVTLHRAVDYLSVSGGRIRPCQAGPSVPTPEAQCQRPIRAELAYGLGALSRTAIARCAYAFAHPGWAQELPDLPYAHGRAELPRQASLLSIDNPAVVLSALKPGREAGTRALRLYNLTGEPQPAQLELGLPAERWCPAKLWEAWDEGAAQAIEDGAIAVTLAPHQIRTLLLR